MAIKKKNNIDFTRKMLERIRLVNEVKFTNSPLLTEENGFVIKKNDTKFGNIRQSQEEQLRQTIGDVELDDDGVVFFPDNSNIVLNGYIKGMNVKFQFKYNDQSGDGCYITGADVQMTDSNTKTLQKIRAAYENWKTSLDQDATIIRDLENAVKNNNNNVSESSIDNRRIIKEEFRRRHSKAHSIKEDVMARFYNITTNRNKPVLVEGVTIDRIIKKHGDKGLVIVSANRSDMDSDYNDNKTRELIHDIKDSGYSYLPVYGGYRGTDGVEDDYEPSFIIFNYDNNGDERDFDELRDFALYCCGKFNQNSVLIKAPSTPPIYVNKEGNKVNSKESDEVIKNDPKQQFFSSLKSKEDVDNEIREKLMGKYKTFCHISNIPVTKSGFEKFCKENLTNIDSIGKRWTYDIQFECYVNPMPCQLSERMRRKGEIMIWD